MSARETMVICQVCGHENESDQRFCDECGAELQPSAESGKPTPNNAPTLDEDSELETEDGQDVKVKRLLSLGRLNRYSCMLADSPALLLEETPTAPGFLAGRREKLAPLEGLAGVWQPSVVFEHNGRSFAVGELPSGPTLDERVRSGGPLPAEELKELASSLALLLQALHEKCFLLRSLQPDRMWWDPESRSLVVDSFERLVPVEGSGEDFQVVNGFSPPEAYGVGGGQVGTSSDLYTAGAILHFAGSGERTDLESRENFFSFDPMRELERDDAVLAACIGRLTAKDARQRLADAKEFEEYLARDTVPPAPVPVPAGASTSIPTEAVVNPGSGCNYLVALQSHVGCVRSVNQDACLQLRFTAIEKSQPRLSHLVVVVDGMGGEAEGDKAASLALRTIAKEVVDASLSLKDERVTAPLLPVTPRERNMRVLERALQRANRNIFGYAERDHNRRGMGCTITACILEPDEITLGHVGDTRAYHLRGSEMTRLTTDHSLVGRLVEMGQLTEEEARNSPQRSIIYRAMGTNPEVEVDLYHKDLQPGDRLMVSSDGVWEYFESGELQGLLSADLSPADIASRLVDICLQRGADDNATLAVIFAT
jgi:serine/threonine protein phosphatase PrpC